MTTQTLLAIARTMRMHQWVKNLFVAAPLVFSRQLFSFPYWLPCSIAVISFCFASSSVYFLNDTFDRESDRAHPVKKNRPIASGLLSPKAALTVAAILSFISIAMTSFVSSQLTAVLASYIALNLLYSFHLKHVAFIDVLIISCGFLLRVLAGSLAIGITGSPWLFVCTGFLACFLGFGKRFHELENANKEGLPTQQTRKALSGYSHNTLQWALLLSALATASAYALYTRDPRTIAYFDTGQLIWTIPSCVIGIARFLQLTVNPTIQKSPTEAMLSDWIFLLNAACWTVAIYLIIY